MQVTDELGWDTMADEVEESGGVGLVLAEHRNLLTDVEAGDWMTFSGRLREHQSHGNDFG